MTVNPNAQSPEHIPRQNFLSTSQSSIFPNHKISNLNNCQNIYYLDLAMTATQIDFYAKNEIFIPYLHIPLPTFTPESFLSERISEPPVNIISCEELKGILEKSAIFKQLYNSEFNSLGTICDFLRHVSAHPDLSAAAAFRTFVPDSSADLETSKGITCAGRARAFLNSLQTDPELRKHNLKGYAVMERESLTAVPSHTAAIVPCNDGLIFVEFIPDPKVTVLKNNEITSLEILLKGRDEITDTKIKTDFKIAVIEGDFKVKNTVMLISHVVEKSTESGWTEVDKSQCQYLLRGASNPDAPVMHRYIAAQRVYPVLAGDKDDIGIMIKVNYDEGTISFEKAANEITGKEFRKIKIPFEAFDPETKKIDFNRISNLIERENLIQSASNFVDDNQTVNDFFDEFQSPNTLREQVFMLASPLSIKIMQDLYSQIKRNKDQLTPP